jgi:putative membrane protein
MVAIAIFYAAQGKAAEVARRLECHKSQPMRGLTMRLVAAGLIAASVGLAGAIWWLDAASLPA